MDIKQKLGYALVGSLIIGDLLVSKILIDYGKAKNLQAITATAKNSVLENKIENANERAFSIKQLENDSENILLARMIFGEARDCNYQEKLAVAYTAINRRHYWYGDKKKLSEILLEPWQYSCFWENSKENQINKKMIMNPEKYSSSEWRECLNAANDSLTNKYPGFNKKQSFYHAREIRKPRSWGNGNRKISFDKTRTKHVFYRDS